MSEATRHTPGPWRVDEPDYFIEVMSADGKHVATTHSIPFTEGEPEYANARLIAAAPDLLSACEAHIEFLADEPGKPGAHERATAICEAIRAAVARAKGGPR